MLAPDVKVPHRNGAGGGRRRRRAPGQAAGSEVLVSMWPVAGG
ncbi:hypothetical protein ACX80T_00325 [Arthrobacter sp. Sr33]